MSSIMLTPSTKEALSECGSIGVPAPAGLEEEEEEEGAPVSKAVAANLASGGKREGSGERSEGDGEE